MESVERASTSYERFYVERMRCRFLQEMNEMFDRTITYLRRNHIPPVFFNEFNWIMQQNSNAFNRMNEYFAQLTVETGSEVESEVCVSDIDDESCDTSVTLLEIELWEENLESLPPDVDHVTGDEVTLSLDDNGSRDEVMVMIPLSLDDNVSRDEVMVMIQALQPNQEPTRTGMELDSDFSTLL